MSGGLVIPATFEQDQFSTNVDHELTAADRLVRWEYFGFPSEANGMLAVYDFPAALATGLVQDGFVFASNFDPNSVPGAAGLTLKKADSKSIIPGDYDNVMPRVGFAWTPFDRKNFVLRGGYGTFFERTTGGFANSLRQAPPFFRELQLNNLGDWNTFPRDIPGAADSSVHASPSTTTSRSSSDRMIPTTSSRRSKRRWCRPI